MFDCKNPDINALRAAMAACDDDAGHHIEWVDNEGIAHITCIKDESPAGWGTKNKGKVKFRLETCNQGNGYVGPKAASDPKHVQRIYNALVDNWKKGTTGYIDIF